MIIIKHQNKINEADSAKNLVGHDRDFDKGVDPSKSTSLKGVDAISVAKSDSKLHNLKGKGRYMTAYGKIIDLDTIKDVIDACLDDISANCRSLYEIFRKKNIIYTDHPKVRTMSTDGRSIYINPAFADLLIYDDNLGPEAVEFVLIHEALHVLLEHTLKYGIMKDRGFGDHVRANRAMDCEVNYIIEYLLFDNNGNPLFDEGITKRCKGWINKEWGDKAMTWEEIYPMIPAERMKPLEKKKMSDEWNRGFIDGYNEYLKELRSKNLIERYYVG